ncbi:MAG: hypothetical protein AAGF24_08070 [Cyanobacteria bacterium P01_H01_bin.121]
MFNFEFFPAAATAAADGVLIPIADLSGLKATELADTEPAAAKESRTVFALLNTISSKVSPSSLGFTIVRSNPSGVGDNVLNQTFTVVWQKMTALEAGIIDQIPVPSSGTNLGLGLVSILEVFPTATKVSAGATTKAGILIPTAALAQFSALTHAALEVTVGADNREWFMALTDALIAAAAIRSTDVATAIVAAGVGGVTGSAVPTSYVSLPNPLSGINPGEITKRGLLTRSASITIQSLLNQDAQTFDVNVVAA